MTHRDTKQQKLQKRQAECGHTWNSCTLQKLLGPLPRLLASSGTRSKRSRTKMLGPLPRLLASMGTRRNTNTHCTGPYPGCWPEGTRRKQNNTRAAGVLRLRSTGRRDLSTEPMPLMLVPHGYAHKPLREPHLPPFPSTGPCAHHPTANRMLSD